MKKLYAKLNSESGASLIIAMLLFLVCVMVASVIVTASSVNAGRMGKQREEQQAYLSVRSAAQLLQEDFGNMTAFVAKRTRTVYTCTYDSEHPDSSTSWAAETACAGAMLADYVAEAALMVCRGQEIGSWEKEFQITASSDEMDPVDVAMTMDDSYNITCVLTTPGSAYAMKLYITGTAAPSEALDNTSYCTHYTRERVIVGSTWVWMDVAHNYAVEVTTYRNTVSWAGGVVTKEVAG